MICGPDGADRINSFALVSYLNGRLAEFIDGLRSELIPGCTTRAHVTVLPPRPLAGRLESALEFLGRRIPAFEAFPFEATAVRVFPITQVIYLDIGFGRQELAGMHAALNQAELEYEEPFEFHPHLTLAQGLMPEEVPPLLALAQRRWQEYRGERTYWVESLSFVQNTAANQWLDLAGWALRKPAEVYSR